MSALSGGFAAVLRARRLAARLTQEELAGLAGLNVRSVSAIERGMRHPRPESVRLLGRALGLGDGELDSFERSARAAYWQDRGDVRADLVRPAGPTRPAGAARAAGPVDGPPPAQLPPDIPDFVGRTEQLGSLNRYLPPVAASPGAPSVCVLVGPPGAGKTTLAVHWAHGLRHLFPDGQLYVDLHGHGERSPLSARDALARALHSLAGPDVAVPEDVDEAAALYRSLVVDRRLLMLLDDAAGPGPVRPLLPGSAGCLVLVTSRDPLAELVAGAGARRLAVGALTPPEAVELLRRFAGDRVAAEPVAARELAERCGHLPLPLRTAAAALADTPGRPIAEVVRHPHRRPHQPGPYRVGAPGGTSAETSGRTS